MAAASVAVDGLLNKAKNLDNGFFDGWAGAALGGALSGGMASAMSGAVSSHLPSANLDLGGGLSIGLSPSLAFGSNGFSAGGNIGVGVKTSYFSAGVGGGIGYTNMSLGANSAKGFTSSIGGGASFGGSDFNLGLYTNKTFGAGIGQQIAGFTAGISALNITYENDGAPFGEKLMVNDQKDRFRTNAVSIGINRGSLKGADLRLNMFTGDPTNSTKYFEPRYSKKVHNGGGADDFRLGALSLGYRGQRVGWNSEGIRNLFQNKFAHSEHNVLGMKILHDQAWFRHLGGKGSFYTEKSIYSNPYSLWSF